MTLSTLTLPGEAQNDAQFRAFVAGVRNALTAVGIVRTSDTGQIDPTTVLRPASSTPAGYDIFRFNDAAQSTAPIFFKVEYGMGTLPRQSLWVTVGTGSNGAGTITDIKGTRQQAVQANSAATLMDCWVAGGDGYVTLAFFANVAGMPIMFFIERARAADGSVDASSASAGIVSAIGISYWLAATQESGIWTEASATQGWPALNPLITPGSYRGATYAYPVYPIIGYPRGASRAACVAFPADIGSALSFSLTLYGATHVFRGVEVSGAAFGRGSAIRPALRYE